MLHTQLHTMCKYCNKTFAVNSEIYLLQDMAFCSESHRQRYIDTRMLHIKLSTLKLK